MDKALLKPLRDLKSKKSYNSYIQMESLLQADYDADRIEMRIAILRNFTTEMINPVIRGEMALAGYDAVIYTGDFDNIMQEVLDIKSSFYHFKPEVVIIALWLETLSPRLTQRFVRMSKEEIESETARILTTVQEYVRKIRDVTNAAVLINNFVSQGTLSLGIYDIQTEKSQSDALLRLNRLINGFIREENGLHIIDLFSLFCKKGYENIFDSKMWAISKCPFGKDSLIDIGMEYSRYIKALKTSAKKCLVLDCDGTLWGGIVGEVGTHGILIGEDYPGRCYKEFQEEILNLHSRGILLALCSKNNEEDVLDVLRNNKEMSIREEHIAAMQVNWNNKADNLIKIAKTLNIGTDSIVFADDSEFECNLIAGQFPEVSVLHLKSGPSHYKYDLLNCGFFDSLIITQEDQQRNDMYNADKERKQIQKQFLTIEAYLDSLEMTAEIFINDISTIERVSQLTQKTNQFNLTTNRYSEEQIRNFINSETHDVIGIFLKDKISSLGLIAVGIVKYIGELAEIDTFLMSCRAIGRSVEDLLINQIISRANKRKCKFIKGEYIYAQKNKQVENLYSRYGMKISRSCEESNMVQWDGITKNMDIPKPEFIKVIKGDE